MSLWVSYRVEHCFRTDFFLREASFIFWVIWRAKWSLKWWNIFDKEDRAERTIFSWILLTVVFIVSHDRWLLCIIYGNVDSEVVFLRVLDYFSRRFVHWSCYSRWSMIVRYRCVILGIYEWWIYVFGIVGDYFYICWSKFLSF